MLSKNEIKLIRSLYTKKGRDKSNLFIAEGAKLEKQALEDPYEERAETLMKKQKKT